MVPLPRADQPGQVHWHRAARRALIGGLAMGLTACSGTSGMPAPVTEQGQATKGLWGGTVLAALVVGAVVWVLIAWTVIRYRHRGETTPPSQRSSNRAVELAYTVVPIVIVAILFAVTIPVDRRVKAVTDRPDVVVEVVGYQWGWQFRYPSERVTMTGGAGPNNGPVMVLPRGRTTRLVLRTTDVIHSFWVPRFLAKRDLIPGVRNRMDVTPTTLGSYVGRCAEFCGLDHWRMDFTVRVVSPQDYERWIARQRKGGG